MIAFEERPSTYRSIGIADGIRASALRTPGKIAITEGDRSLTYRELADRTERLARAARAGLGLEAGQHTAIMAPNCLEFVEMVSGLASAGAPPAMVNSHSSPSEVKLICDDSEAQVLFVHPSCRAVAEAADLASVERIVELGEDYERLLGDARRGSLQERPEEWSTFCIPYTSGTTGLPKGVLLPHRARTIVFFQMAAEFGCYGPDDRALAITPLYHGAGFGFAAAPLFFGGHVEVMARFEPEQFLGRLSEGAFTNVFMVPSHFHRLFGLDRGTLERLRPQHLRTIISNAAPLPQPVKEQIVAYFGEGLLNECYGCTEAATTSNLRPADQLRKERCVGLPLPLTEVRVLDDDGREVGPGEVGELFSRSPTQFAGYWNKPEETAKGFRDGWFSPGDLAWRDEEGYIYIVDRKSDTIISGGVNIFPGEIERVLVDHPAVREAAVFGVPDDYWGEAVQAAVVLHPGASANEAEILAACGDLGRYKLPKRIDFIDALPRNTVGKVLRRELRDAHRPPADD